MRQGATSPTNRANSKPGQTQPGQTSTKQSCLDPNQPGGTLIYIYIYIYARAPPPDLPFHQEDDDLLEISLNIYGNQQKRMKSNESIL